MARAQVGPREVGPFMPASGQYQAPSHLIGTAGTGALVSGKLTLVPFDVGPRAQRYDRHVVNTGTAQQGGTSTTYTGVYGSRSDYKPDLTNLLASSNDMTLNATNANRLGTIDVTLQPGRYWNAFLWVATVDPTTFPQVYGVNPSLCLPSTNGQISSMVRGYSATGLTALPTTQITLAAEGGSTAVAVFARAF